MSTLDTLSGGRVRLGIGVGWQDADEARGARMDEVIALLRAYWGDARVDFEGTRYRATAMSMEPKPPHGRRFLLWIGGSSEAAYHRAGRFGDGWMGSRVSDAESPGRAIESIHRHAENAGRDPRAIGLQSMVAPPPRDEDGKRFYAEPDRVVARVAALKAMGFGWAALNATVIFQAGARSVGAMIDALATLHARIRAEVG